MPATAQAQIPCYVHTADASIGQIRARVTGDDVVRQKERDRCTVATQHLRRRMPDHNNGISVVTHEKRLTDPEHILTAILCRRIHPRMDKENLLILV